MSWGNTVQASI